MSKRLTEWLPVSVKPTIPGVYERDYSESTFYGDQDLGVVFNYWDGKQWGMYDHTAMGAYKCRNDSSSYQALPWRGLAENPEK